jgi:hypothetical protein
VPAEWPLAGPRPCRPGRTAATGAAAAVRLWGWVWLWLGLCVHACVWGVGSAHVCVCARVECVEHEHGSVALAHAPRHTRRTAPRQHTCRSRASAQKLLASAWLLAPSMPPTAAPQYAAHHASPGVKPSTAKL